MLKRVPRNLIILAVASLFGLGAAWLAARYLEERATEIELRQQGQMGHAVVAKTDLAVGTPLTRDLVAVREGVIDANDAFSASGPTSGAGTVEPATNS